MADEQKIESGEGAADGGANGAGSCRVNLPLGKDFCGRPIHRSPKGVDDTPVCLMHSKDPGKQTGPLFDQFLREFEEILEAAGEGKAGFERFFFPSLHLAGRKFRAICRFELATFTQHANFEGATFTQHANFEGATFTQHANFEEATFTQDAVFRYATFTQNAVFRFATFTQDAVFRYATFTQGASCLGATFTQDADFSGATFTQDANFRRATFTQDANFSGATFTQDAVFWDTIFHGTARWEGSRFRESAKFRNTKFVPQVPGMPGEVPGMPGAIFALATFTKPGQIVFDDVDLSRALFHNCDVSQVWFTSSALWGQRGKRRAMVFDETIPIDQRDEESPLKSGKRDYHAVEQIYQQLKKNYDARLDYWTANEFHFGEMEMKRLAAPVEGKLLGLRRRWHPWLSFVALYRWGSDYGNSYVKPIWWLLGVLLFFALMFPLPKVGLRRSTANYTETYVSVWQAAHSPGQSLKWKVGLQRSTANYSETYVTVWQAAHSPGQSLKWEARLLGKSILAAIDTATFQKSPEYAPAYPWGRVLAVLETLLTSTLFALLLLAIRRQFRR